MWYVHETLNLHILSVAENVFLNMFLNGITQNFKDVNSH